MNTIAKNKVKIITIYDASIKKNKTFRANRDNFETDEQYDMFIKKKRDDQKLKNKIYRAKLKKDMFDEVMGIKIEPINEQTIKNIIKLYCINNVDNFKLDKNTANTCVIFGSSKTGKTTLLVKLYDQYYSNDNELVTTLFSGNQHLDIYKLDKKLIIADGFNKQSEKYIKLEKFINTKTNNHYKFLNMFDDIINTKFSRVINDSILTYRNANISTIMLLQYGYLLSKPNRANVNNVFIFRSHSQEAKKDMIELFLKDKLLRLGLRTYNEMLEFYDEVTDNYGFFYIHNGISPIFTIHRLKM